MVAFRLLLVLLTAPLVSTPYVDPGGAFALNIPAGWKATRETIDDGLTLTEITKPEETVGPHIDVLVQAVDLDLPPDQHTAINQAMAAAVKQLISAEGTITRESAGSMTIDGKSALKIEMDYKDEDGNTFRGWIATVCGKRRAFAIMVYVPTSDMKELKEAEAAVATIALDSKTPRSGASSAGASILGKGDLSSIAGSVKKNMKRQGVNDVLVAGDPPLTYGSVANFVNVIEILFDIQFTEAEFNATKARFIEYYNKQDAEGKRILALQGESLLKGLTTGPKEDRDESRRQGRAVFENAFKNGAQQGIGYAEVMWRAISRRQNEVAEAKAKPKRDDWDQEITEGDLDATLEMLYFMWVAAGRDASDVTEEDVAKVRMQIIEALPTMDPQLQLVIANAPKVYAGLRQTWMGANQQQRMALAQQFGACLDEWGIGAQSSFEQSGGGGGGGGNSLNADIAMNTAWNAAKTWTTTSSP